MILRTLKVMVFACAALAGGVNAMGWEDAAETSLRTALREAHPDIVEWQVRPLTGREQRVNIEGATAVAARAIVLGARSAVRLTVDARGSKRDVTLWYAVGGSQEILTARARIDSGVAIDASSVQIDTRDAIALGCKPVTSVEQLQNMRATRAFGEGAALCADGIEPRPAVSRGETVLVRSVAGAVTIIAKGIALADGTLGETLKIKNPDNRRTYFAAVTGAQEVTIHD